MISLLSEAKADPAANTCEQACCLSAARHRNLLNRRAVGNELVANIRRRFTRVSFLIKGNRA